MKAILIDVENQTVSEIEVTKDIQSYHDALKCQCFCTAFRLPNLDCCFVDDEGLLAIDELTKFFTFEGAHQPFAGNGLIVGGRRDGESAPVKISVDEVRAKVKFKNLYQVMDSLANM